MIELLLTSAPLVVGFGTAIVLILALCAGMIALARRRTDAAIQRQSSQLKVLNDRVVVLQQGLTESRNVIQALAKANRKLVKELGHVAEATEEGDPAPPSRLLH
jgi:hypothetical protein